MKIYSLLIGINNYNKIPKLRGCVGDIEKVERYLRDKGQSPEILKLLDKNATKYSIVNAFNRFQNNLSVGDTFLFYFAGHGTQEYADPIWKESDQRLESIVCYDENPGNPFDYLLCDKELRYLIYNLSKTGSHIITIFDCCHSGDNTRNAFILPDFNDYDIRARHHQYCFQKRRWEDFIFHKSIPLGAIAGKSVNDFLPQGTHVQIAACEPDESAMEVDGEGVFTKTLLKVLADTGGNISYHQVRSRVRQYLRFVYEQQPRIYAVAPSEDERHRLLFTRFLTNVGVDEQTVTMEAVYNNMKGWTLNLGAIHGLNKNTIVNLTDPVLPRRYPARIKEIFIDYALIDCPDLFLKPGITTLEAMVGGIGLYVPKLYMKRHDGNSEKLKIIADVLTNVSAGYFVFTEDESAADYCLHVQAGLIFITLPGESFRPLVEPIEFRETESSSIGDINSREFNPHQLLSFLKHISRWTYTKKLENTEQPGFYREPLRLDIVQLVDDGTEIAIVPRKTEPGQKDFDILPEFESRLKVSLTNETSQKLFVAVAYLTYNFKVDVKLLERATEIIYPDDPFSQAGKPGAFVIDTELIHFKLPDVVREYNWPGYSETLKIFISHEEFCAEALRLDQLPPPFTLKNGHGQQEIERNFDFDEEPPMLLNGWTTQTVELHYQNIFFNKVEAEKIQGMLDNDKMAFFARGLYA